MMVAIILRNYDIIICEGYAEILKMLTIELVLNHIPAGLELIKRATFIASPMFGLIGLHTIFIPLIGLPTRFSNQPALTLIPMQSKRSKISWTAASRSNRKRKFKSNNSSIEFIINKP